MKVSRRTKERGVRTSAVENGGSRASRFDNLAARAISCTRADARAMFRVKMIIEHAKRGIRIVKAGWPVTTDPRRDRNEVTACFRVYLAYPMLADLFLFYPLSLSLVLV